MKGVNPALREFTGLGWASFKSMVVFTTSETTENLREKNCDKKNKSTHSTNKEIFTIEARRFK